MDPPALLLCLSAALVPCHGFNVDVDRPISFQEAAVGFGQSLAMSAQAGGLFVGAPLQRGGINDTGRVYKCDPRAQMCQQIRILRPADAVDMSLGLSLAATDSQVLVCGPTVRQACGENMYVRGYCFLLDRNLRQTQRFPETLPECPRRQTDILFLIDGSGSVHPSDFLKMKAFVVQVMRRFRGTETQFAVMQFSSDFTTAFDFKEFRESSEVHIEQQVQHIVQKRAATWTASAIRRAVQEVFVSKSGTRAGATKVLIVITDGEKYGDTLDYTDVIPEANRAGIIRYAIGVGNAFFNVRAQEELRMIASSPASDHIFQVDNFNALQGLQEQLKNKIFAIEGTQSHSDSSFQLEMSQDGFSSLLSQDGSALGAVGAYDWSGGIIHYKQSKNPTFINVSRTGKENDAYLGYAVQPVASRGRQGYVVGAPRYQHVGKVVLFYWDPKESAWKAEGEAEGDQIGSYFGGSLSTMDVDGDGNTDLILVGAPMYYGEGSGGRVFMYPLPKQGAPLRCKGVLQGQGGEPLGRFGASLAVLGDVDGDGHADLAVGAPLEDGARGALYIFRGQQRRLRNQPSQRISGTQVFGAPRALGLALSGGADLTGDNLKDIAVGAHGQVLLLRSRPVLQATVTVTFAPTTIPTTAFNCQGREQLGAKAATAQVCFSLRLNPKQHFKGSSISGTFRYELVLDPGRVKVRAAFDPPLSAQSQMVHVSLPPQCQDYNVQLPVCPEDTLAPITLRLTYNLTGNPIPSTNGLTPILAEDTEPMVVASLPFDKNCGSDGVCEDNLQIAFNFSGLSTLVVGDTQDLQVTIQVHNLGEDSYGATLRLLHPAVLSYRKVQVLQASRQGMAVRCSSPRGSQEDPQQNTTCLVGPPIFHTGAQVVFATTLDVPATAELGNRLQLLAVARSDNHGPGNESKSQSAELPVKYAIHIIVTGGEDSTQYTNFSSKEEEATRTVIHRYEIRNLRQRSPPLWVTFEFPVAVNGVPMWVTAPKLANCYALPETPGIKDLREEMKKSPLLGCAVTTCQRVRCNVSAVYMEQPLEFVLTGNISFGWFSQTGRDKVTLVSTAEVGADPGRFHQQGTVRHQVQTVLERVHIYNYVPIVVGSSIGGLLLLALITAALYKFGFFRRQYKEMMEIAKEGEGSAPTPGSAPGPTPSAPQQ
ncbi:integrin alpha-M isoform X1 [Alligator mississippiensis]|uniref:integrin alpha-M isoform X1 n=1 Tax=Alligator mississippiensis TaxID=8496 RepID=UPI0028777299|nr:integrin alpha-M isoform X1 [Alligator mississippiensis]